MKGCFTSFQRIVGLYIGTATSEGIAKIR